jgi:hypothetical protein
MCREVCKGICSSFCIFTFGQWAAPKLIFQYYVSQVFFYKDSSHYRIHTNTESLAIYMRDYSNKVTCNKQVYIDWGNKWWSCKVKKVLLARSFPP